MRKKIVIAEPDYDRLRSLLESAKPLPQRDTEHLNALRDDFPSGVR